MREELDDLFGDWVHDKEPKEATQWQASARTTPDTVLPSTPFGENFVIKRFHLLDFVALFISSILVGALTGGLMNALNGWVSPAYFGLFFLYPGGSTSWTPEELYWHIIWQGCKEGLVLGGVIAVIFTTYVFVVSRAQCRFVLSALFLPKMAATALVFWFIGGFNGVVVGLLFPDFFSFLVALGGTQSDRLKFLWVGGSIYGAYFGSLMAICGGCHWFKRAWRRRQNDNQLNL